MKKNYATKVKSFRNLFLTISIVGSAIMIMGFGPMFLGPGITTPEPFNPFVDTSFTPEGIAVEPYEEAFPNLDFDTPLNFNVVPGQNKIVIGQRDGKVFWFPNDNTTAQKNLVIDLSNEVGVVWDGGFLGLAIHPNFGTTGSNYFYVYYTSKSETNSTELNSPLDFSCGVEAFHENYLLLERYEVNPTTLTVVPNSKLSMFKRQMYNTTHRGGGMEFGDDGFLYLSTGDQATYANAQDIAGNMDGGVLRLDVNQDPTKSSAPIRTLASPGAGAGAGDEYSGFGYWIPNTNPFNSQDVPVGSIFKEYYSMGHRNPHRMTKDSATGTFYIGEVGESTQEEINVLSAGKNYGWPLYEGTLGPNTSCVPQLLNNMPHEGPLTTFPTNEVRAIIGGYVYNGTDIPGLQGQYICAGYNGGREIFQVDPSNGNKQSLGNFQEQDANGVTANPVSFGQDDAGELYILSEGDGVKLYKLKGALNVNAAPLTLTATGAFTDVPNLVVADGFIPYDMIESFWSDGAYKKRWMAIPNDGAHNSPAEQIEWSENGIWNFPVGSVIIKQFDYPIDDNNPAITRKVETRFSIKGTNDEFYFLTYKWRADQLDADLVDMSVGANENINVTTAGGGSRTVNWRFPSNTECITCHSPALGGTLGPNTRNLNSDFDYVEKGGVVGNQLVTLSALGILNENITDTDTPGYLTHVAMNDPNGTLEEKARSYMDNNCAYCHQPATGNRAEFDLRLLNTLSQTKLLTAGIGTSLPGIGADQRIVYPGDASKSQIFHRANSIVPGTMMPPLAKTIVDQDGVDLIEDWINQLVPLAGPPPAGNYRIVNRATGETLQVPIGTQPNGANIAVGGYEGLPKQHFALEERINDDYYELRVLHSDKYMDVQNGNTGTNINVWQFQSNNELSQTWELLDAGDNTFNIVNKISDKYLGQNEAGNVLVVDNDFSDAVRWEFLPTTQPFEIGLDVQPKLVITGEDGTTDEISIALKSAPVDDVVVLLTLTGEIDEANLSATELTFTSGNWNIPQLVTVTGTNDGIADGVQFYNIEIDVINDQSDTTYAGFSEIVGGYNEDDDGGAAGPPAPSVYRIINVDTGLSMEVLNAGVVDGTNIQEGPYQAELHEQFELVFLGDGLYSLVVQHTGKALDVQNNSNAAGTNVWQYTYSNSLTNLAQLWRIEDAGNGTYYIISERGGHYLTVEANGNIQVNVNNGSDLYKWQFEDTQNLTNAGVTVSQEKLYTDEDGETDTFTVVLDEEPTAEVLVGLTISQNADEVTLSEIQLSFTTSNWNIPQTVTVTGIDDVDVDGVQEYVIEALVIAPFNDPNYTNGLGDNVTGVNYDNDGGNNGAPRPGVYQIRNIGNQENLMPLAGTIQWQTNMVTGIYDSSEYQHYEIIAESNDLYSIRLIPTEQPSGRELFLDKQGGANSTNPNVWSYQASIGTNPNLAQLWQIVADDNGSYQIISAIGGDYLRAEESNGNVSIAPNESTDFFKWQFLGTGYPPIANSSADIFSGNEDLTVQFSSAGSTDDKNDIVSYSWDFGNGDTSNEANPLYTYEDGGTFDVVLTIEDGDGFTAVTDAITIVVNGAPVAEVSSDLNGGEASIDISFIGDQSTDDVGIESYLWTFEPGQTSTDVNPLHTFTTAGTYNVTLTVTDEGGLEDTTTIEIIITAPNQAPVAVASSNVTGGIVPLEVEFTGDQSTDDLGVESYLWTFEPGETSAEANPTYTFNDIGVYTVELTVTDIEGLESTTTIDITVTADNEAPVAVASSNVMTGDAPLEVQFTGDQSTDDVGVVSYLWTFELGETSIEANPTYTFNTEGTYIVTMVVTDAGGLKDETTVEIIVTVDETPVAVASASVTQGEAPLEILFTGDQSAGVNDIVSYAWDFGNGDNSTEANPTYTYNTPGTFDAILIVTDSEGLTGTSTIEITVDEVVGDNPTAVASADVTNGEAPLVVSFVGDQSTSVNQIVSYAWDFGDGETSTEANPTYIYNTPGTFIATLLVTDSEGLTDTSTIEIIVTGGVNLAPIAVISSSVETGEALVEIIFTGDQSSDDTEIVSYAWDFGDGNTSVETNPTHVYNEPGEYLIKLVVADEEGLMDETTLTLEVLPENAVLEKPSFEFILTPNPSTNAVQVLMNDSFDEKDILGVMIHDVSGRLIRQFTGEQFVQNSMIIPTDIYRNEIYVITVLFNNNEPVSKRLIINN